MTAPRRGTIFWSVVGVAVTAGLGWMLLKPRPLQGGWKALDVYAGVEATDPAAERLNARLDRLVAWRDLRNSERLRFRLWEGRVVGDAKVMGDDWDLAVYLRALRALSVEERARLDVVSEPEGERLAIVDGRCGRREPAVAHFLDELAGARPNLEGEYSSLRVEAAAEPAALRAAMERQMAGFEWSHVRPPLEYAPSGGGVAVTVHTDGDVRTLVRLLDAFESAVSQNDARLAQRPCRAVLDGKRRREVSLAGFEDWFKLRDELAVAEGPLDPAPISSRGDGGDGG